MYLATIHRCDFQGPRSGHARLQESPHFRKTKAWCVSSSFFKSVYSKFLSMLFASNGNSRFDLATRGHFYHKQCSY